MSGLRVAIVSRRVHPAHGPGGLERAVHDHALHLARAGVAVELISETPAPERREAANAALGGEVRLTWVDPGPLPIGRRRGTVILDRITNYPLWARNAARAVDPEVDLIHVHGLAGLGVAERREAGELRRPLVLGTQGMEEFLVPGRLKRAGYAPFRAWMRRIASIADRVIVTDEGLFDVVAATLRVPASKLVTVPNAIDPEACVAAADTEAARRLLGGSPGGGPLLVSVGRIAPNKGFAVLAAALGRARLAMPEGWRWVLVGDGPVRGDVERAVAAAGIGPQTLLAGAVDDAVKHGLLALADWFVHPTLYEGSSLVTLEAMSHAVPVIATRAGGLPDKVQDRATGLLVEPGDEAGLAAALATLGDRPGREWGAAGRRLLEDRFSWRVAARAYLDLYRELSADRAC